jgi:RNA polymerase sigma-70 factor (ECF subfamily)
LTSLAQSKGHGMDFAQPGRLDRPSFEGLVAEYADRLYSVALRITGSPADAEDAVQEAFTSAYRHWDRYRGESSPQTWLYRIAVNASLASLRQRRPREYLEAGTEAIEQLVDWSAQADAPAIRAELRAQLERAISDLPPDFRAAVVLRDVDGLSAREAAQVLEISEVALKSRLHRGRVLLRQALDDYLR